MKFGVTPSIWPGPTVMVPAIRPSPDDMAVSILLETEDVSFEVAILFPGESIEVVGSDVEQAGDVGAASGHLQLSVAYLQHHPRVSADLRETI